MKVLRYAVMIVLFSCACQSMEVSAEVDGSSGIVNDVPNNKVRGYHRTELDYAIALLTLSGIIIGSAVSNSLHSPPKTPPEYRAAYERWRKAIDSNPALGDPFWVSTDSGPAELRSAVGDLLSLGPNLTAFLVEEMRSEKDQMRLYQLVILLNAVSGINLYDVW